MNKKAWLDRVNPIIRGKVNYFLNLHKAIEENKKYGQQSRCFITAQKQKSKKAKELERYKEHGKEYFTPDRAYEKS